MANKKQAQTTNTTTNNNAKEEKAMLKQFTAEERKLIEKAVNNLASFSRNLFESELLLLDEADSMLSVNIIKKLENDAVWEEVKEYILKKKGWELTKPGKVADVMYKYGNTTDQFATKVANKVGDALIWMGKQVKKHSGFVGDVAAFPLRASAQLVESISETSRPIQVQQETQKKSEKSDSKKEVKQETTKQLLDTQEIVNQVTAQVLETMKPYLEQLQGILQAVQKPQGGEQA